MRALLPIAILSLVTGLALGAGVGLSVGPSEAPLSLDAPGSNPSAAAPASSPSDYTALYEQTIDSVVKLRVTTVAGSSQGSGFLYDNSHIVTNEHVVQDADTVLVQFSNGEWRTGQVVGTDVYTDLAVVRVDSKPASAETLPVARTAPKPGEPVAALGSPFGLEGTITQGIVSGVNRSMRVEGGFSIPDTVQTDAPINPGNSGGPLVSMEGTVVGVNRAKEGDNIGFAISAAVVSRVVPALIQDGTFEHSYIGVRSLPVTPQIAEAKDLEEARGLLVVETVNGTPAADTFQTGEVETSPTGVTVEGGDVIVAVEGRSIQSHQDLSRYLLLHTDPGETVSFTVIREGERQTLTLELIERPPA